MAKNGAVKSLVALVDVPMEQTGGPTENAPTVAPDATNGKRGRKPADKWSYKWTEEREVTDDEGKVSKVKEEKTLEVKINVPDLNIATVSPEKLKEYAEIGYRQKARSDFQKDMEETVPAVAVNMRLREDIIEKLNPAPELVEQFMAGKPCVLPTEWTFKG